MSIVYRTILELEGIEKFRELIFLYTINHNNDLFSMCTLWNGPVNRDGYGFVRVTFRGCRKILTAHRLAYYISHSSHYLIPNIHVSHLCHNKLCVTTGLLWLYLWCQSTLWLHYTPWHHNGSWCHRQILIYQNKLTIISPLSTIYAYVIETYWNFFDIKITLIMLCFIDAWWNVIEIT